MARYQEENKEAVILQAAEEEFLAKGFAGARTVEIARKAGVTHAMLHYYFKTKEQLFEKIVHGKFELMLHTIPPVLLNKELSITERVRQGVSQHFDILKENAVLPRFVVNEMVQHPEYLAELQKKLAMAIGTTIQSFQADLNDAHARGEICQIDTFTLLFDIISLNIFVFMATPLIEPIVQNMGLDLDSFLAQRKEENIRVILKRLAPEKNIL